jgi:very-short-patch-repair endonuclease
MYSDILPSFQKISKCRKKCKLCGKEYTYSGKKTKETIYCSHSCASKGSVTDYQRKKASETLKRNGILGDIHSIRNVLYKRELWKYAEIQNYLIENKITHEFEHIIGEYVFDLYLPSNNLVVEFDGPEHRQKRNFEYNYIKSQSVIEKGYKVIRIDVTPNTIIRLTDFLKYITL